MLRIIQAKASSFIRESARHLVPRDGHHPSSVTDLAFLDQSGDLSAMSCLQHVLRLSMDVEPLFGNPDGSGFSRGSFCTRQLY